MCWGGGGGGGVHYTEQFNSTARPIYIDYIFLWSCEVTCLDG